MGYGMMVTDIIFQENFTDIFHYFYCEEIKLAHVYVYFRDMEDAV